MKKSPFTIRALVLGLLGILLACLFPVYGSKALGLGDAVKGYLPVVPLFLIVVLSLGWNMLAGKLRPGFALSGGELCLVFCLMLVVSWIPSIQSSLVTQLVLPRYEELTTNISWKEAGVTTRMPDRLFPRGVEGEVIGDRTHIGMIQGKMPVNEIPFSAWLMPLLNWMPLILVLALSQMALAFVVHRQWTKHEQLRYPLAAVGSALLQQGKGKPGGTIFRNRLFWFGFAFVFLFLSFRYLHTWFPSNLPKLSMEYSVAWSRLFPSMGPSNTGFFLLQWQQISFALIGIACLVSSDVSLSMGLTAPLGTLFGVQYYLLSGNPVSADDLSVFRAGGYIAFGIIMAYTGRSYYWPIFLKAIWPGRKGADLDPGGVWAARVFLVAYVSLILIIATMGVDLFIAWIVATMILLIFLVVTRLVCETGVPMIVSGWSMPAVLTGLLGPAALGAAPLMFLTFLGATIVSANSSQLAMPYMATSLRLLDDSKVNLGRFVAAAKIAIIVALLAGFAATITLSYTRGLGGGMGSHWDRSAWSQGVKQVLSMMDFGQYEASQAATGLSKLGLIRPDFNTVGMVLTGLVTVVLCYILRFRFAGWPLHPLFFVVIGTGISNQSWVCFLLGWMIKTLIVKVGGGRAYRSVQPLFIGIILGDIMSVAMQFIVGAIYYNVTGTNPVGM